MKERLMFEEYENLETGVVVKNRQGMLWIPGYRVDSEGHLEKIPATAEKVISAIKTETKPVVNKR